MSLSVIFSNSLDALAEQLIERLGNDWKDPFHPPELIVPSAYTFQWLQSKVVDRFGIDAVWSYRYLEKFLWDALNGPTDTQGRTPTPAGLLQLHIMRLLQKRPHPWLRGPFAAEIIPDRLMQMSETLAGLFLEYFSSRDGLIDAWENGKDFFTLDKGAREKADEQFQRELYGALARENGLWTIANARRRLADAPGAASPRPVYLFNVTGLGLVYYNLLATIAETRDVVAWILNPCAAFWEDVLTVRERRGKERKTLRTFGALRDKDLSIVDEDENPLLRSWGDYGKKIVKAWSERAADYAATEYIECPPLTNGASGTLLQRIQNALLYRMPGENAEAGRPSHDGSLSLYACKGRLRQLELLRDWLWEQIRSADDDNRDLPLEEIGVYFPDPRAYAAEIALVFDAWPRGHALHVPWGFEGRAEPADTLFASAVDAYLALMEGGFTRPQVMAFLSNPLVMEKTGITDNDLDVFRRWVRELGIFRGFDAAHRGKIDHKNEPAHTWEQGMDRLLLGIVANRAVTIGNREYLPYRDIDTGDSALAARFIGAVQRLWDDRRTLQQALCGAENGWETGASTLHANLKNWVGANGPEDAATGDGFFTALDRVAGKGDLLPQCIAAEGENAAMPLFLRWARSLVPAAGAPGRGNVQGKAVVFRALRPGAVFPHRVCALVGFGAREFPGERSGDDALDLRRYRPQSDDADIVVKNRHAFLEAVVCARERLALFYQSMDAATGEETPPAGALLELLSAAGLDVKSFRTVTPLLAGAGDDKGEGPAPDPFPVMDPAIGSLAQFTQSTSENPPLPRNEKPPETGLYRLTLSALKRWLDDPFTAKARRALGRDDDDETVDELCDEEPFATPFLGRLGLIREVWESALLAIVKNHGAVLSANDRRERLQRLFDAAWRERSLRQELPEGMFAAIDAARLFDAASVMLEKLRETAEGLTSGATFELLRIARPGIGGAMEKQGLLFEDIHTSGGRVTLLGAPMVGAWTGATLNLFVCSWPKADGAARLKNAVLPWLFAEAFASAKRLDFDLTIHEIGADNDFRFTVAVNNEQARHHLQTILTSYMDDTAVEHLPMVAIAELARSGRPLAALTDDAVTQWLLDDAGKEANALYRNYSPFVDLTAPRCVVNAAATATVRYGALVNTCYPPETGRCG
jgi:exonuclease V gamma subunit